MSNGPTKSRIALESPYLVNLLIAILLEKRFEFGSAYEDCVLRLGRGLVPLVSIRPVAPSLRESLARLPRLSFSAVKASSEDLRL
jgi:hypothetical protein